MTEFSSSPSHFTHPKALPTMSFPTTTTVTTPSMFPFGVPPQIPDEINLSPPLLVRQQAVGIPPIATPFKPPRSFAEIPPWMTSAQMEEMLPMPPTPPRLVRQNAVVYDTADAKTEIVEPHWLSLEVPRLKEVADGILKYRDAPIPCPYADVLATGLLSQQTFDVAQKTPKAVELTLSRYAEAVKSISAGMEASPEERAYGYAVIEQFVMYLEKLME
jgi:hypothetical protein